MPTSLAPVQIAGKSLGEHSHVCALFNTPNEEYRVLMPFIRDGLARGERVVHGVERKRRPDHFRRLRAAEIDADAVQRSRQLEVRDSEDTYMPSGEFDQEAMLALVREMLEMGAALGYPRTRLMAHPECVFETWRDTNNFLQYEARLNYLLPHDDDVVVCLYDYRAVGAGVLMDILRTHALVIYGQMVQENPFYMAPEEFLRDLRARAAPAESQAP